ncbi:hypothetical protein VV02_18505 [Luteipulveratus mongoliensis]|uniref:DUF58 domain-containing protein n=2 Tax=Luteipulveratus mongoliensis TaxID=571913 RepID=A0A0K1JR54_9MICO|nr:hypothetical protein VV02_18505 [Luteipulveratus mongoliensis]
MTVPFVQGGVMAGGCGLGAVLMRRPDLLILAMPFIIITAWSIAVRPRRNPVLQSSIRRTWLREGEVSAWDVRVENADDAEQVVAVLEPAHHVVTEPDLGIAVAPVVDGCAAPTITWQAQRWGRRTVGNGTITVISPWAAFRYGPVPQGGVLTHTAPREEYFTVAAAAPHPLGLVGPNRSRRPGDGSEFADIRPFQTGDRLRRIHWPVSARTGQLHVRTSYAEQDTEVMLLVDAILDVGVSEGIDGRESSLDLSVRSASALAAHFLARGERVGLHVFGMQRPIRVPAGMGARQLRRISDSLAEVRPDTGFGKSRVMFARVRTGAGALVIMLSPLITRDAAEQVAHLAQRGLTVVVVDCLPPDVEIAGTDDPLTATAWRIRRLERELEVARLQERGVPVVPWRGPGSLDLVLRQISRRPAHRSVVR